MLDHVLNDALSRVGKGTPMGDTMRRYSLPALLSFEILEPDCPPVRVRLLGEDLVAFRSTDGRIGLVQEGCPHRRASLYFGRNEECGIRCVYHGWKFDVDGNCVDQMNEPRQFKERVKITAYPTLDMGGVIWAYLGPADKKPARPEFELTQVPDTHRYMTKVWQECNWLQALEGGIDTSHAPILHRKLTDDSDEPGISPNSPFLQGAAPDVEVENTDYGYRYAGIRDIGEKGNLIRGYHYVMPSHQLRPLQFGLQGQEPRQLIAGHVWVPMDDENCMVYNWVYNFGGQPLTDGDREEEIQLGRGPGEMLPDFRTRRNKSNDWMIDRQVQKTETFTGIEGINIQDQAIQESMGPIVDRTKENLSASDLAIVIARRMLIGAASTVADGGDPPGTGDSYYNVRAIDGILPKDVDWKDALESQMYPH